MNHWLVEANYADDILDRNIADGRIPISMRPRLLKSHMEIETIKGLLSEIDLSQTQNIVLIYLSDGNSNEKRFVDEVISLTGKPVFAANKGLVINVSRIPY